MSRPRIKTCLTLLCAMFLIPPGLPGQSSPETNAAETVRRRLPNYFGQIGLSDRQRERIYAVQAEYNSQIEQLEERIEQLKSTRDTEIETVLTDAQKRRLNDRREEARLAREARRQSDE